MEMVRYRLIGPLSHTVLTDAFSPATQCNVSMALLVCEPSLVCESEHTLL